MDFFMRYYKKTKAAAFLLLLSSLFVTITWAASSSLSIKSAELLPEGDAYSLDVDFDIAFSKGVEDAINKGVPLNFLIEFQVVSLREYWFDDEVVSTHQRVTISYHALSRQYLVNRGKQQLSFDSLQEAKEELSHLRDWVVVDKTLLKKGEGYEAALRIRLDQSKLPKPLQVDALASDDWVMVSERYRWPFNPGL